MSESTYSLQFDSSPRQPWHLHPRFHRYWEHYHSVRGWYYNYWFSPYTVPSMTYQPHYYHPYNFPHHHPSDGYHGDGPPWDAAPREQGSYSRRDEEPNTPEMFSQTAQHPSDQEDEASLETSDADADDDTDEEEDIDDGQMEMEVSQEMKEFFALSEKHREKRKKEIDELKQKIFTGEKQEYINAEDMFKASISTTCQAPSEKPGERRRQEMKILYGNDAAMIHGMETALQLQFDRNCDKKQPKLWPSIPLKF